MDDNDEIFNSPDLPAELSALAALVEAETPPTFRQRARFPLLLLLIFLIDLGLVILFEDFINKPPDKVADVEMGRAVLRERQAA